MGGELGRMQEVKASGSVIFTAGVPSFAVQSGDFEAAIIDNGTGDITLRFVSANGMALNEYQFIAAVRGPLAASQLTSFGCQDVNARDKRITILREGAAGAVSALADVDFSFAFIGPA